MDSFIRLVQDAQALQLNKNINNAAIDHALILSEYLLKEAAERKKDIKIVSGSLRNEFYNDLYKKTEQYLEIIKKNQTKIDIIILSKEQTHENNLAENKFANFIKKELEKSSIKFCNDIKFPHFFLVGDRSYRYETNHKETKAVANFNNKETGKILELLYNTISNKAS